LAACPTARARSWRCSADLPPFHAAAHAATVEFPVVAVGVLVVAAPVDELLVDAPPVEAPPVEAPPVEAPVAEVEPPFGRGCDPFPPVPTISTTANRAITATDAIT
jgi:hypothetical protein